MYAYLEESFKDKSIKTFYLVGTEAGTVDIFCDHMTWKDFVKNTAQDLAYYKCLNFSHFDRKIFLSYNHILQY